MPTPSLILVPARFKTGKLYTPVATTSGGVVLGASGDFNVTRATTATRVNASGLIEVVASGIPRLDYYTSGGTAGCPALLVEPSAQNIMAQSETLSVSGNWSRTNVLVSGGVIASPDGLTSGTLIVATSGNTQHSINRQASSVTSGAVVTVSCFLKAHGTNTFVQITVGGFTFSPANPFANFNLSGNGAITTGTYSSAFIQNYGNGWYRCGFTTTAAANGSPTCLINPILASGTARDTTFQGDGVNGVYAWGFQVETGSVATSYIPTTTAAVTRNADVISVSGAVSGCVGQTEGTVYWEGYFGNAQGALAQDGFQIGNNANNYIYFGVNSGRPYFRLRANAINAVTISPIGNVIQNNQKIKIAIAYKSGNSALFVNGTQIGSTDTASFTFSSSLSAIEIGSSLSLSSSEGFSNSPKKPESFTFYTTRLTDTQLAALTTL
jgi:hypothetical protein